MINIFILTTPFDKKTLITFREATISDIPGLHAVRMSVHENILSNLSLATPEDYTRTLTKEGKGWVCESDSTIVGFAIVDTVKKNVWALFVHPQYEGTGIGSRLHKLLLEWYFSQDKEKLWLSTDADTRADRFYRKAGWKEVMRFAKNEVKFEMTYDEWKNASTQIN